MNWHGFILPSRIIGILILLPAVILIGLAIWFYSSTRSFLATAVPTQGTVVAMKTGSGTDGDTYTPVFTFWDAQEQQHRVVASFSSNPPRYAVGQSVEMLYDPAAPSNACPNSFLDLWLLPVILGSVSLVPLLFALSFIWFIPFTIKRVWPDEPARDDSGAHAPAR